MDIFIIWRRRIRCIRGFQVFLSRKIGNYIDSNKGKCEVFAAPFAVYLDEKTNTYVEPDVSVYL